MTAPTTPAPAPIRGLTVRQPWSFAIAKLGKNVENRTRKFGYRGWLAIHAGASMGTLADYDGALRSIVRITGRPISAVDAGAQRRSVIVAVARLADVCSAAVDSWCGGHGPWGEPDAHHLLLAEVRPLADPVPCKGALGLWRLPADVETAVRAQVGEVAHG